MGPDHVFAFICIVLCAFVCPALHCPHPAPNAQRSVLTTHRSAQLKPGFMLTSSHIQVTAFSSSRSGLEVLISGLTTIATSDS